MQETPSPPQAGCQQGLDVEYQLDRMQARIFRVILAATIIGLFFITLRGILMGEATPYADLASVIFTGAVYAAHQARPNWRGVLTWVVLAMLFADVLDGILPLDTRTITSTHLLLPLLVLYGAVLGNLAMSVMATLAVLGIYSLTAIAHRPLSPSDWSLLTNLGLVVIGTVLLSITTWRLHHLLIQDIRTQNVRLQQKLAENRQLQAILYHDIANPLTGLQGTIEIMKTIQPASEEVARLDRMVERIFSILQFVRLLTRNDKDEIPLRPLELAHVVETVRDVFSERLRAKGMILQADIPKGLKVHSHADILTHSVLANLVSNAIKFSPKGSSIQLMARHEGKRVRIQLFNPGTSIPEAVLNAFRSGDDYHSSMGTEGEAGMGHGLRIVSATLQQLQGYFSIRNDVHGVCMDLEVPSSEI